MVLLKVFRWKKELLEEIVVDEMHIAHIYKACGFNLRLLSLWLLFHWYISFLSKVSVGESQTHAKADNAMSRIGDYSIS